MDELKHFGVKGMKWGIRKKHSGLTTPKRPKKQQQKDAAKRLAAGYAIFGTMFAAEVAMRKMSDNVFQGKTVMGRKIAQEVLNESGKVIFREFA